MVREMDRSSCWDEPLFRYLLAVEVARARRAQRPFLVLAVDVRDGGGPVGWSQRREILGSDLLAALAQCLRESDLVGWHRAGARAAALLTETAADPDTAHLVGTKVLGTLGATLPADLAQHLRVRIYRSKAPGDRLGFHRLFAASGTGEAMRRAAGRNTPTSRKTLVAAGMRPTGIAMVEQTGHVARQESGAASGLGEHPLPRRARARR
jgi:hypothetical protein